jgi:phosphopantothenate synthetase
MTSLSSFGLLPSKTELALAYGNTAKLAALTHTSIDEDYNTSIAINMLERAGKRRDEKIEYIESSISSTIPNKSKEAQAYVSKEKKHVAY